MAGTVAAYYSIGTEPDTRGLVYALWKRGSYVLLPVLRPDGDLDWASYEGPDSLVPGPRGLLEPGEPPRGPGAVARADVVLAPALAVDRAGNRLGRGGGSYDRALARVGPLVPLIALVYEQIRRAFLVTAARDVGEAHTILTGYVEVESYHRALQVRLEHGIMVAPQFSTQLMLIVIITTAMRQIGEAVVTICQTTI